MVGWSLQNGGLLPSYGHGDVCSAAGRAGVNERDMREIVDQVSEQLRRDIDAAAARRGGR